MFLGWLFICCFWFCWHYGKVTNCHHPGWGDSVGCAIREVLFVFLIGCPLQLELESGRKFKWKCKICNGYNSRIRVTTHYLSGRSSAGVVVMTSQEVCLHLHSGNWIMCSYSSCLGDVGCFFCDVLVFVAIMKLIPTWAGHDFLTLRFIFCFLKYFYIHFVYVAPPLNYFLVISDVTIITMNFNGFWRG